MSNKYTPCPCDNKRFYHKCCKVFHDGALPDNAELLMRSRYSAYAMGLVDYIIATTHRDNPHYTANTDAWRADLMRFCDGTKFPGLKVHSFEAGSGVGSDPAFVTFTAFLTQGSEDATFTEKSSFLKEDGKWFYRDGDVSVAK